jgi:sugar/nucleoside kinase (ribokinase family)
VNKERPLDVLVVGDLFLDLVMSGFESWPRPGEESVAKKFHKEVGGGAAITACGLSKLGLQTAVLGIVGKEDGQWMLDQLRARGVDTSRIQVTSAEPTAFSVSVSTAQDRTFLTYTGANRGLVTLLSDLIGIASDCQVRHIHLAHAMDLANLQASFKAIKDNGWSLSVDVGWHPEWYGDARALAALKLVDVFFPNQREAAAVTQETEPRRMLDVFQRMGLRRVALKLGRNGAALLWDGNISMQKPGTIASVDTTGAGDCFDAGFLYAWLGGMEPALCLKAGAACGEMSTRAMGGIAGFPSKEELETILCAAK